MAGSTLEQSSVCQTTGALVYWNKRGYVTERGLVLCGRCAATSSDECESYNPLSGDDFCSGCDQDITRRHTDDEVGIPSGPRYRSLYR